MWMRGVLLTILAVVAVQPALAQTASYTVKPGDMLEISVWKEPDLQRQVLVRPDGAFSFPLVGEVDARGKTVAERIYEPLGEEYEVPPGTLARLALWHEALEAFRARKWNVTRALLEQLSEDPDYARLVSLYSGYLRDLEARPPGEDWDAAFTLYEK